MKKNLQEVKILALAVLKDEVMHYVDTEVFDKRRSSFKYYSSPTSNLHNSYNKSFFKRIKDKLSKMNKKAGYDIKLMELIVTIDLNSIYENETATIKKVNSNYIEVESGTTNRYGHLYIPTTTNYTKTYKGVENIRIEEYAA